MRENRDKSLQEVPGFGFSLHIGSECRADGTPHSPLFSLPPGTVMYKDSDAKADDIIQSSEIEFCSLEAVSQGRKLNGDILEIFPATGVETERLFCFTPPLARSPTHLQIAQKPNLLLHFEQWAFVFKVAPD